MLSILEKIEAIGKRAPIVSIETITDAKIAKCDRPKGWEDFTIFKHQQKIVRLNFFKCPIVKRRLEEAGLPLPAERFKVPAWGARVPSHPMIKHKKTGELYLWCLGEGVEPARYFSGPEDITDDPRLVAILAERSSNSVPNGMMTYVLRLDSIISLTELSK